MPVRSTGASDAIGGLKPVVSALAAADFVADCTVEGLLHAPELGAILAGGARILMISNEHPEILERLLPDPALKPRVDEGAALLAEASQMRVTSAAGTDLTVDVSQAPAAARWRTPVIRHREPVRRRLLREDARWHLPVPGPVPKKDSMNTETLVTGSPP